MSEEARSEFADIVGHMEQLAFVRHRILFQGGTTQEHVLLREIMRLNGEIFVSRTPPQEDIDDAHQELSGCVGARMVPVGLKPEPQSFTLEQIERAISVAWSGYEPSNPVPDPPVTRFISALRRALTQREGK